MRHLFFIPILSVLEKWSYFVYILNKELATSGSSRVSADYEIESALIEKKLNKIKKIFLNVEKMC